jgi:hypothetical protein
MLSSQSRLVNLRLGFTLLTLLSLFASLLIQTPSVAQAAAPVEARALVPQAASAQAGACLGESTDGYAAARLTAPASSDTKFVVTEEVGGLDCYYSRSNAPNSGSFSFSLPVTRYYSPLINATTTINGRLNTTTHQLLVQKGILPAYARLTMAVYDVDNKTTKPCPEANTVAINGVGLLDIENVSAMERPGLSRISRSKRDTQNKGIAHQEAIKTTHLARPRATFAKS